MADSIFFGQKIIFKAAFAEFINGNCLDDSVSAVLHVDLSTAMVYVADLLRFCSRNGDFYLFIERKSYLTFAADNLRDELIFFADSAG